MDQPSRFFDEWSDRFFRRLDEREAARAAAFAQPIPKPRPYEARRPPRPLVEGLKHLNAVRERVAQSSIEASEAAAEALGLTLAPKRAIRKRRGRAGYALIRAHEGADAILRTPADLLKGIDEDCYRRYERAPKHGLPQSPYESDGIEPLTPEQVYLVGFVLFWSVALTERLMDHPQLRPPPLKAILPALDEMIALLKDPVLRGLVIRDPLTNALRPQIIALAAQHRLPAVYASREFVDAGGLMVYGSNVFALYQRTAAYVDKLLKGAKPSELPVERAGQLELVINLRAAKTIGLTIPPAVLARADEVIQ